MDLTLIEAIGQTINEKKVAVQAALMKAKQCLGGCPHCQKVTSQAPESSRARSMKIGPEMCKVRTVCALQPQPVKPPQCEHEGQICPILARAA